MPKRASAARVFSSGRPMTLLREPEIRAMIVPPFPARRKPRPYPADRSRGGNSSIIWSLSFLKVTREVTQKACDRPRHRCAMKTPEETSCVRPLSRRRMRTASARLAGLPITVTERRPECRPRGRRRRDSCARDGKTFAERVPAGRFAQGEADGRDFLHLRRDDLELESRLRRAIDGAAAKPKRESSAAAPPVMECRTYPAIACHRGNRAFSFRNNWRERRTPNRPAERG